MINIKIQDKKIGPKQPIFIIAEAGVNHDGDFKKALALVDIASQAGADAVKFQTFQPEKLLIKTAEKPSYQKKNIPNQSQFRMLKRLMLSEKEYYLLFRYCQKKRIIFLSTPYDEDSANFLDELGLVAFKLASIEVVNHPFLKFIAKKRKPVFLSVGLAEEEEIKQAVEIFKKNNAFNKLVLLHCHTDYPTKTQDANLTRVQTLQQKFNLPVGYSDHTKGIFAPVIAACLGAKVIEKHFTWNRKAPGPDHSASIEKEDLKKMIKLIRKAEILLGDEKIKRTKSEEKNLIMRKSLVASKDIPKKTTLIPEMLAYKRPGNGLWPTFTNINKIVGKKAKIDISRDTILKKEMFI